MAEDLLVPEDPVPGVLPGVQEVLAAVLLQDRHSDYIWRIEEEKDLQLVTINWKLNKKKK